MTPSMQRSPRSGIGIFLLGSGAMALIGGFHLFLGIAALLSGDVQVVGPSVPVDLAAAIRGWLHLLVGGGVLVAVVFLISGAAWARRVGIGAAGLGALLHLSGLPQNVIGHLSVIALDLLIIWVLSVYGQDFQDLPTT
jgi:hypothetical protein